MLQEQAAPAASQSRTPAAGRIPFVDLAAVNAPHLPALRAAFERVVGEGEFSDGRGVEAFEARLAARVGADYAVGVASGTAALHLALVAAGVGGGDEVILPSSTFFASAEAVVAAGARPVLVDIDPATGNLDPAAAEVAVTTRTAAVIAVHLYGQPADMTRLRRLADRHALLLLEDAAQALGARWEGRAAGSLGDAAAFSFYPTKNLGALGQAGAVTTSDRDLARRVAGLRQHGGAGRRHDCWGYNERLDAMQAAFLSVKLAHLDRAQRQREEAASRYRHRLAGNTDVSMLATDARATHANHLFVVRVPHRDRVREVLAQHGIGTRVHYPTPIHRQPVAAGLAAADALPHADAHSARVLSLPLYPGIPPTHVDLCTEILVATVGRLV